jgi:hypothetical protein
MLVVVLVLMPQLPLGQNKHVLRESRCKGALKKSVHKAIYFISQIINRLIISKTPKKKII